MLDRGSRFLLRWGFAKIIAALILLPIGILAGMPGVVASGIAVLMIAFICFTVVISHHGLRPTLRDFRKIFAYP